MRNKQEIEIILCITHRYQNADYTRRHAYVSSTQKFIHSTVIIQHIPAGKMTLFQR